MNLIWHGASDPFRFNLLRFSLYFSILLPPRYSPIQRSPWCLILVIYLKLAIKDVYVPCRLEYKEQSIIRITREENPDCWSSKAKSPCRELPFAATQANRAQFKEGGGDCHEPLQKNCTYFDLSVKNQEWFYRNKTTPNWNKPAQIQSCIHGMEWDHIEFTYPEKANACITGLSWLKNPSVLWKW